MYINHNAMWEGRTKGKLIPGNTKGETALFSLSSNFAYGIGSMVSAGCSLKSSYKLSIYKVLSHPQNAGDKWAIVVQV